jgi:hypothetical protein
MPQVGIFLGTLGAGVAASVGIAVASTTGIALAIGASTHGVIVHRKVERTTVPASLIGASTDGVLVRRNREPEVLVLTTMVS